MRETSSLVRLLQNDSRQRRYSYTFRVRAVPLARLYQSERCGREASAEGDSFHAEVLQFRYAKRASDATARSSAGVLPCLTLGMLMLLFALVLAPKNPNLMDAGVAYQRARTARYS
jgi:hypothetical protein